jgi:hypothetical protein
MTQAEFNAWIRARFNLWTKSDVDAAIKAEREACAKLCEDDINSFNGAYYLANKIRARGEA